MSEENANKPGETGIGTAVEPKRRKRIRPFVGLLAIILILLGSCSLYVTVDIATAEKMRVVYVIGSALLTVVFVGNGLWALVRARYRKGVSAWVAGPLSLILLVVGISLSSPQVMAKLGYPPAQYDQGVRYHTGTHEQQNFEKAAQWFRKAAKQGHVEAQKDLAVAYANGDGVPQDFEEAVKWSRKAAKQGHAEAQKDLGAAYANGKGVPQDFEEAVKWSRKAAEQGNARAQHNLAVWYANGEGVPQDFEEAAKWFRKAAGQGVVKAQRNLAVAYHKGKGVPQNLIEAYRWIHHAAVSGESGRAKVMKDELKTRLTETQLTEAKKLISDKANGP